eukprot:s135_g13.t1
MAISDTQIQEEMLAAITAKALPVVAAACTEVCSRHLAALHQQLQQLRFLQQQVQQLQAQANFQAQDQRQSWPASRSSRSASPLRRALEFTTNSNAALPLSPELDSSPFGLSGGLTPITPYPDTDGTDKVLHVMKRVRSAVRRSRQSPEQLFKRFCKAGGAGVSGPIMTRSDFIRVLGTFEPNLEQETVLRLWQHLVSQGSGDDGLNFAEFQRWFVNGEGLGTLSRTTSSSTSLALSGNGMEGGYLDAGDRPSTAPCGFGSGPGGRRQSRPPFSPAPGTSPAFFANNLRGGAMTLPIPSRSESGRSLQEFVSGEMTPLRSADEMALIAAVLRLGRGLAADSLTVAGAFVLYDEHLEKMLSLDKFLEASPSKHCTGCPAA